MSEEPTAVETPTEAPVETPTEPPKPEEAPKSWRDELPDDLKELPSLKDYKDLPSLAKSHDSLQKHLGNSFKKPADDAPKEEWDKFYNKLGRPETPDGYKYERPEIPEGMTYNENLEKEFMSFAHERGMTQGQVKDILDYYNDIQSNAFVEQGAAIKQAQTEAETKLRKEWKNGYDNEVSQAIKAFQQFADKDDANYLDATGKGNDPVLIKVFNKVAKAMSESRDSSPFSADDDWLTPDTAKKESDAIRNDKEHPLHAAYFDANHKDHARAIKRMEELTAMRVGSEGA